LYLKQFGVKHQSVSSLGEIVTLEMQLTELVQVPNVQLMTLDVVVEILHSVNTDYIRTHHNNQHD